MERVRSTQDATVIPFKCDGPDVRRLMELVILPIENNGLELRGNIITIYDRLPLIPATTPTIPTPICPPGVGAIESYMAQSG